MDLIINRRHAAQGQRDTNDACPAVVALKSVGFEDARATTFPAQILIKQGGKWETFTMPKSLRDVISRYDAGGEFKTGVYRIIGLRAPRRNK